VPNRTVNALVSHGYRARTAGRWLSFRLPPLYMISKNGVGRTGFEPVTSSVSGKSKLIFGVCHRRTESSGEPLTWAKSLSGSC